MWARPLPQPFAPDDERGLHQVEAEAADPALREGTQDVRVGHESVADADRMEALAKLADFEPLLVRNVRHVLGLDLHDHDALVQYLVVLQGMQQRDGERFRSRDMKIAVPGTRAGLSGLSASTN